MSDDDNEYAELTVAWYVGDEIVCDWAPYLLQGNPSVMSHSQLMITM